MGKLPFRQVHLDFHTSELIPDIGAKFDKKQFQDMLKLGHVNSITVFAKCHHGWAYHETKKNKRHPNLNFDLLDKMLSACHEIGVQTPVYVSAGLDEKIAREHPEWLLRNKDESVGWNGGFMNAGYHLFCFNSPYFELLIEQVVEIAEQFKDKNIEGFFLDIVSPRICYCQNCVKLLRAEGDDPRDEAAVKDLGERTYKKYYTKINEAIRAVNPNLRIFHNGGHIPTGRRELAFANTHLEIESLPTGGWGYDHFPMSARYVQGLGLEFLGMTGKFHTTWGEFGGFKHPNALKYEVALSVANGAKCSIGDQMHPEGFLDPSTYALIGAAYAEVEKIEQYCDDVESVADIALFGDDFYAARFGGNYKKSFVGASRMLLEGKYLFDIVDQESELEKYKLVVLPDCIRIDDKLKAKLDEFAKNGGKILASGLSGTDAKENQFAFDFGAEFLGKGEYRPCYFRPEFKPGELGQADFVLYGETYEIKDFGGEILGWRRDPYFNRDTFSFSSHQHTPQIPKDAAPAMTTGKDGIYIASAIFEDYATKGSLICKEIAKYALDALLGDKKTFVSNLCSGAVATLMKQPQKGRYINHLLYAAPTKRGEGIEVIEDLVPLYDIKVELLVSEKIKKVYDAKTGGEIEFGQEGEKISFAVDELNCHKAVVLEY
ncbi:MAG: beta-galactosidase trimerization domain-containing protein [Oscillospiraceae bacterium]|nr:beta-galactosidase trimerization domain-containing protein [Oscillospiraceae bacterium]MCL2159145.1 beta-galactosidase trimerization domain-containing protein [Oscillospiraceae bacterium]